ncbi:hypothetical protein KCU73_g16269, partial [Aureobasidium melanogenum]
TASPITVSLPSSVSSASTSSYSSNDTSAAGVGLNTALFTATSTYPQSSTTITTSLTSTSTGATTTKASTLIGPPSSRTVSTSGIGLRSRKSNDQYFWDAHVNGTAVQDEWTFCEVLGDECGPVLEQHYSTYVTTDTIDKLASVGVNFLRIPTTYAAWVVVPGSELYHGDQQTYLRTICEYAIGKHGMRVVVGLHSLPGGVNGLDIGEALDHDAWFFN